MSETTTKGVKILGSKPSEAIIKLSFPMAVGMFIQTLYSIFDGIWVSWLGTDALAAIGLFFPIFMGIISIAVGISIGGSSAISRYIGAKQKKDGDNTAITTILLGVVVSVLLMVFLLIFGDNILIAAGAKGNVLTMAGEYLRVFAYGIPFFVYSNICSGIFRGEGNSFASMVLMIIGSVMNIILDPVFIYLFKMGIAGAAWASVFSIFLSSFIASYWLFVKKNSYLHVSIKKFNLDFSIIKEIFKVGFPASLSQFIMSVAMFILNIIVVKVGGLKSTAVFTSAWRIIMIGLVPLFGISSAVTAVCGHAFGAKEKRRLSDGYFFGIKLGIIIEAVIVTLILIFAPYIAKIFTFGKDAKEIYVSLYTALRILVLFLPFVPFGMITSSMFQGIGFGNRALIVTVMRTLVMQVLFSWWFGFFVFRGINGVWFGIITGNIISGIINFFWGKYTIAKLNFAKNI